MKMSEWYLKRCKCLICKEWFIMEKGHPVFKGKYTEQYCPKCLQKYRNPDGSIPPQLTKGQLKGKFPCWILIFIIPAIIVILAAITGAILYFKQP